MPTPQVDLTFQPGAYVFGYSLPGHAFFGRFRLYPQQGIFGLRPFGAEITGFNTEDEIFRFRYGSPNAKSRYWENGFWHTSSSPWPATPLLSAGVRGPWNKRIIFYSSHGKPALMRYSPYHGSAKQVIVPWQLKLMEAAFMYSILTDVNKARLKADALRTRQATQGGNYFKKLYILDDPRWMDYV